MLISPAAVSFLQYTSRLAPPIITRIHVERVSFILNRSSPPPWTILVCIYIEKLLLFKVLIHHIYRCSIQCHDINTPYMGIIILFLLFTGGAGLGALGRGEHLLLCSMWPSPTSLFTQRRCAIWALYCITTLRIKLWLDLSRFQY